MPMPEPITLQRAAVCADCGANIPAGEKARWYAKSQKAYCAGQHAGPGQEGPPSEPDPGVPFDDNFPPAEPQTAWGFHQKDVLMFIESCAKGSCAIYAAALAGGQIKEMPKGGEVTSLARVLENHGTERFKALMEEL